MLIIEQLSDKLRRMMFAVVSVDQPVVDGREADCGEDPQCVFQSLAAVHPH